jgi:hypothetical protein
LYSPAPRARAANRDWRLWLPEVEHLCLLIDEMTRGQQLPVMTRFIAASFSISFLFLNR